MDDAAQMERSEIQETEFDAETMPRISRTLDPSYARSLGPIRSQSDNAGLGYKLGLSDR